MKKLAEFSVRFPITVMMLILATLLLGYISFDRLGIDLFPNLNTPRIFIELESGERPPEDMEVRFVRSLESLAIRQRNVVDVSSITRSGSARITVEYAWDTDMDEAFLDLQKNVNSFAQNVELDAINITQHDPNTSPIALIGVQHPQISDMDGLRRIAENYIRNELVRLEGIAAVEVLGGQTRQVIVDVDMLQLDARDLTLAELASRIQASNVNASGGSMEELGKRYVIKGIGEFQDINEIGEVIIAQNILTTASATGTPASSELVPVRLKEIANIYFANDKPLNIVRINGQRCIALAIYKETRYNTVKAAETLAETLDDIRRALPDYQFEVIENQAQFIEGAIEEVEETALIGILLAVMILYVFLRRIGTTAVISIAIPISVVATFNLMYFNDLSLNIMTLGGLALGAGMLVDNAIVVMENIFRHLEQGATLRDASIYGTAQVGGAITASTLTTIIVFLPIVYLHGAAGELFKEQAWTVAFSLLSSLVVAIMVIPMLSVRFLKQGSAPDQKVHAAASIQFKNYGRFLGNILQRRKLVLLLAALLVVISVLLIPIIGSEFIPRADSRSFRLDIKLAEGSSLNYTDNTARGIEAMVRDIVGDDLQTLYTRVGPVSGLIAGNRAFFEDEHTATMSVFLKNNSRRGAGIYIHRLQPALSGNPELTVEFIQEETALQANLGIDEAPVQVDFKGEDLAVLQILTEQARGLLDSLEIVTFSKTNFDDGRPEINIEIDRTRAGVLQIDPGIVSSTVADRLEGRVSGNWTYQGEEQEILVRTRLPQRHSLPQMYIKSGDSRVRLDDIADIASGTAPREIYRSNQSRIGRVSLQTTAEVPLSEAVEQISARLKGMRLPPEYSMAITGEASQRSDSFNSLQFALLLSIILIYMVLAAQFESLLHPFTIILTIPMAGVGAVLIFFLMGDPLNIMAYIGIIMLMGIAVNDSIILVDAINQLRKDGNSLNEAIIAAGERRIRPIIMTSMTTILALLPLTFGFGESAALRAPMALAVIGGLVTSTLLTLAVIPCAYAVMESFRQHLRKALPVLFSDNTRDRSANA